MRVIRHPGRSLHARPRDRLARRVPDLEVQVFSPGAGGATSDFHEHDFDRAVLALLVMPAENCSPRPSQPATLFAPPLPVGGGAPRLLLQARKRSQRDDRDPQNHESLVTHGNNL